MLSSCAHFLTPIRVSRLKTIYHSTQIAPANAAIEIWPLVIAMVEQLPRIKQLPNTKISIRFLPNSADLKLKNGISLTNK
jgi:hypothetical protein